MQSLRPPNSCRQCGSTNYHRLFARDAAGALRPNGNYQCSGCQLTFTQASEWRSGTTAGDLESTPDLHRSANQTRPGTPPA